MHAGGSAKNGGEKRNVPIVNVWLPIAIDLALRSKTPRPVNVLWVCQAPILQGMAATPTTLMGDVEVEDQAPAASPTASLVSQVVPGPNLHVAAPLSCACRDSMLGADRVSRNA